MPIFSLTDESPGNLASFLLLHLGDGCFPWVLLPHMDATKTDSSLQWETSVGGNLYENEIVFPPIYSARAKQPWHPIKMLVLFPQVSFLRFYWSSEENSPISLSQNLQGKIHFRSPSWNDWIKDSPLGHSAYSLHCSHSSKIMNHVSQDVSTLASYHWLR